MKQKYVETIGYRVAGIPCQIGVIAWDYQAPYRGSPYHCDSDHDCYGWEDSDWEVLDRKGYRAKWLEAKLTDKERERVSDMIGDRMRQEAEERKVEAAIERFEARRGW